MLLNSLVLPNGIWQMQLFQINQSEDSSKITIMYDNPSGQLHQQSITWAFNYNRTYSNNCFACLNSFLNVKPLVGAFHQENAIVGAFSVIKKHREPSFEALLPGPPRAPPLSTNLYSRADNFIVSNINTQPIKLCKIHFMLQCRIAE